MSLFVSIKKLLYICNDRGMCGSPRVTFRDKTKKIGACLRVWSQRFIV